MFSNGKRKLANEQDQQQQQQGREGDELRQLDVGAKSAKVKSGERDICELLESSEKQQFLDKNTTTDKKNGRTLPLPCSKFNLNSGGKKANLAKQETIDEDDNDDHNDDKGARKPVSCLRMVVNLLKCKRALIPLVIISCLAAIYCIPYVEIQPQTTNRLPHIPFNFGGGPLRPSSASHFKVEHLFRDQISGPESVALDSSGNMYMAIDGGFILYAHLNKSSPIKRHYYTTNTSPADQLPNGRSHLQQEPLDYSQLPELVKIAELNGIVSSGQSRHHSAKRRRECLADEKVYGPNLYTSGRLVAPNEIDTGESQRKRNKGFVSNVVISRCSKPLGIRLSPDENYLYVIDTRNGLYRVSLNAQDKSYASSNMRFVVKLVDFQQGRRQELPVTHLDLASGAGELALAVNGRPSYVNVSMTAVDDLAIDYGAGTLGGDIIYMSLSSQNWMALSYLYDLLEARPSGGILRFDSGSNQTSLLDPSRVAHVRTSSLELNPGVDSLSRVDKTYNNDTQDEPYLGIGAPRLDENDVFDDRPLHFPNGLELTRDRQAILIADTSNKRIIKHYIRGARKGTSDLWAWTPHFPDNIRRGIDPNQDTYWVVGCGQDPTGKLDLLDWLQPWPRLRKFLLKNFYLIGWLFEQMGAHVFRSTSVRDFGYSFKIGHSLCESMCPGMMILQYNSHGDIIRSIYSKEFPSDLVYYSQVNEVFDAKNQEHYLYLSSPSYKYVTKLTLLTESRDLPSSQQR